MAKQNQGYRKDLNLDETTVDIQALNNLAGAGIAGDIRIIQNNLRNTSSLAYSSNSNGFFVFPESVEAIFTNDDVVSVGTTVSIGSTTLQPSIDYYICNSNGETQFKISTTSSTSDVGVSTITISGTPSPVAFDIIRKNPVHKENLRNYIPPEVQDAVGEFNWPGDINGDFVPDIAVGALNDDDGGDSFIHRPCDVSAFQSLSGNGHVPSGFRLAFKMPYVLSSCSIVAHMSRSPKQPSWLPRGIFLATMDASDVRRIAMTRSMIEGVIRSPKTIA